MGQVVTLELYFWPVSAVCLLQQTSLRLIVAEFAPNSIDLLQRMVDAVEQVRQRLAKSAALLANAGLPYAVVGGNAVAAWVATVDQAAVRNTQDVDLLIRRSDFAAAKVVLEGAGFVFRHIAGLDMFLDHVGASPRQAIHLIFAREFVKPGEALANPDVDQSVDLGPFRVLRLDALIRIKLTAFRDKDRTHLRDMIGVKLIDASWTRTLPPALAERLQGLLDTPDG